MLPINSLETAPVPHTHCLPGKYAKRRRSLPVLGWHSTSQVRAPQRGKIYNTGVLGRRLGRTGTTLMSCCVVQGIPCLSQPLERGGGNGSVDLI